MEHKHGVYDSDTRFSINSITRQIKNESKQKTALMQNDHCSERFGFILDRFIEGHDMSLCNQVEVHYLNSDSKDKDSFNKGLYTVDDLQVSPDDPEKVVCSWLISQNATQLVGKLSFRLRFKCVEDGVITYAWHTAIFTDIIVSAGINADESFEMDYVDIIEQWKEAIQSEFAQWHEGTVAEMSTEITAWKEVESGKVRGEMTAFSAQWNDALNVERKRIDQFVKLPSGSTAGDAELQDIRVAVDGTVHESAGAAVRAQNTALNNILSAVLQADGGANPMQPLLFDCFRYYRGLSTAYTETPTLEVPTFGMVDLPAYKAVEVYGDQSYAIFARLKTPIPAFKSFANLGYRLIVKTDQAFNAFISFAYHQAWAGTTFVYHKISLKAGYNIIDLHGGTFVDEGHDLFRWVGLWGQSWANNVFDYSQLETLEMYLVRGDAFIGWITEHLDELSNSNAELTQKVNNLQNPVCNIVCWGDSLTAQGGWTTTLENLAGLPVKNAGIGGENSQVVMARQGADVMIVNNITIPAETEPITIATYAEGIKTEFGRTVRPLLQGGSAHVNPVKIGDIEGTLAWTGSAYNDNSGTWTFTRTEAGEAATINRPTAIRTAFDRLYNDRLNIPIIFMGTNDGTFDVDNMVNQHRLMIAHAKADRFLVLGLSRVPDTLKGTYEKAMRSAFGRNFLSLREYMVEYGLADQGLTATADDTATVANGNIPPQLTSDGVHYTNATKTMIGNLIYKRFKELNWI